MNRLEFFGKINFKLISFLFFDFVFSNKMKVENS